MTREEAVGVIKDFVAYGEHVNAFVYKGSTSIPIDALNMAIEALQDKWIPIKWHEITDEEREREGYPKDWDYILDCIMPDDGQRILITTKGGFNEVELDECYCDGEYALDSGYDWIDDVIAWMPLPESYKESAEHEL